VAHEMLKTFVICLFILLRNVDHHLYCSVSFYSDIKLNYLYVCLGSKDCVQKFGKESIRVKGQK